MGSSGKKRTTMAKLNRESRLREKRADKDARKAARKLTGTGGAPENHFWDESTDPVTEPEFEALGPDPDAPEAHDGGDAP